MKIAAVVPAFNEEHCIEDVIREINSASKLAGISIEVIVVNDCSRDKTGSIIDNCKCIPLQLPINLGIGGAMQTGFRYAFENNFDYVVQVDGDGQHPPAQIVQLLHHCRETGSDVVIGSRFLQNEGFQSTILRRAGIRYFQWLIRMLIGIQISDSTSGFRLLNKKALELAADDYPDEYPEPESLIRFAAEGLKISEFPVLMKERQGGISSIRTTQSFYYMFKVSLAILYSLLRTKTKKTTVWKKFRSSQLS